MKDALRAAGCNRPIQIDFGRGVALHIGNGIAYVAQKMRYRNPIEDDHLIPLTQEGADQMGADEARATGYENTHTSSGEFPAVKRNQAFQLRATAFHATA